MRSPTPRKALAEERKTREKPQKDAEQGRQQQLEHLQQIDDPRAKALHAVLNKKTWQEDEADKVLANESDDRADAGAEVTESLRGRLGRPTDSKESAAQRRLGANGFVDPRGLPADVGILRAHDDPCVPGPCRMKPDEVPAIERQQNAAAGGRVGQDVRVGDGTIGLPSLERCDHVVAELAQRLDDLQREVLVRVERRHESSGLVASDGLVDLRPVGVGVRPGLHEIGRAKRGVIRQQLGLCPTESPVVLEHKDWDAGPHDARRATQNVGRLLNPRPGVADFLREALHNGGFLGLAEGREFCFELSAGHDGFRNLPEVYDDPRPR